MSSSRDSSVQEADKATGAAVTHAVTIDINVRLGGSATYCGYEDIADGVQLHRGERVWVMGDETDLVGWGTVTSLDAQKRLVYLDVDWPSMRPAMPNSA